MPRETTPALLIAALPLLLLAAAAPSTPLQDPEGNAGQQHAEEETKLAQQMLLIEDAVKKLRRSLRKEEQRDDSLALTVQMQAAALACKAETPTLLTSLGEEERVIQKNAYRLEMLGFLEQALLLERALLEGDQERAREIFAGLRDTEDPGHERFTAGG